MPRPTDWIRRERYVYQGDGRLWIRITVTLPGGRRVDYGPRQCPEEWGCGKTGAAKAHLRAVEIVEQIRSGQLDRARAVEETFLQYADRVRADRPVRESSLEVWQHSRALWADSLGALPVRGMLLEDVQRWFREYQAATEHGPATMSSRLGALKFVLRAAHRDGIHPTDFGRVLRVPSVKDKAARHNISVDQLAAAFEGPWASTAVYWATLSVTGMRRGELEGLQPNEMVDGHILLSAARTKTGQPRAIPVPAELWEPLLAYAADQARWGRGMWHRVGQRGMAVCGLLEQGATPHSLRRMAVSELGRMGFRQALIQVLIGHKGQTMTQFYDGPQQDELRAMVEQYWAQRVRRVYLLAVESLNSSEAK